MASSSSSASSTISFQSDSTREPTLEYDPMAAYEVLARPPPPPHWDAEEWDFQSWSEDDESLTNGEDLHLLLVDELEEDDTDDASWEEDFSSSSEEEADSSSTKEDSEVGNFLLAGSSENDDDDDDDDEETEDNSSFTSSSNGHDGSNADGSSGESDVSIAPPTKPHKTSGVYRW
jgi:hypothetical protein